MPLGISTQSVNREHSPFKSPAEYSVIDLWPLLDDLGRRITTLKQRLCLPAASVSVTEHGISTHADPFLGDLGFL